MRIGIIGTGQIGTTAAVALIRAGHDVLVGSRRQPPVINADVERGGIDIRTGTVDDVATFGDVVVLAIPYAAHSQLDPRLLAGRIVIDTTNYFSARDGSIAALDDGSTTSSELVRDHYRDARIVKAMHTLDYRPLGRGVPAPAPGRLALPVSSDDSDAADVVAELINDMGFDAVLTGSLAVGGRAQQPFSAVFNKELTALQIHDALPELEPGYPCTWTPRTVTR